MHRDPRVPTRAGGGQAFASFRSPGFGLFFASSTFSAVDMSVRAAVHGWLVLELSNDSAFWLGMYALLLGLGQFSFAALAGALVDRYPQRRLLLIEAGLSTTLAALLAGALASDALTLWMALAVSPLAGCLRALRFTAANRFVYALVGPRRLVNGVALWRLAAAPMMLVGAVLAGWLIEEAGVWAAYMFIAAALGAAIPLLLPIAVRDEFMPVRSGLLRQIVEGARAAAAHPPLRTLFTLSAVMELLGFAYLMMIPVVAKLVLVVGGVGLGLLQGGVGGGMLLSTLVMARVGDAGNKPRTIMLNAAAAGVALIGFSLSRSLPLSIFLAMTVMAFLNSYDLTLSATMQLVAPLGMRGRAVSLHSMATSFTAVGGFLMGAAASVVGAPLVLTAGGAGILLNLALRARSITRIAGAIGTAQARGEAESDALQASRVTRTARESSR